MTLHPDKEGAKLLYFILFAFKYTLIAITITL